ncbi:MAG: maleylpyruvate isomerase family mycothiol-dependent enzyme [Actinomycetota bacterium]|nr:maleylpyruvate isomerase family mycothiol-dependent enzyme [Actinomycetota bacterium]
MAEVADLYKQLRDDISALVTGLEPQALEMSVPATPGWSVKDIVAHLAADATYVINGDFPAQFFQAFGEADAVAVLNDWTGRHVEERKSHSLEQLLQEWNASGDQLIAMMRGETPWPDGSFMFADRALLTDATVHQQDIFGALGIEHARDSAPIKIGLRGYITVLGWRLASSGVLPLQVDTGEKSYTAGDGEPAASVKATPFELFRAMSGRRSPEQIAAYEWQGDPAPYIPYFYPYGIRQDALVE